MVTHRLAGGDDNVVIRSLLREQRLHVTQVGNYILLSQKIGCCLLLGERRDGFADRCIVQVVGGGKVIHRRKGGNLYCV